MLKLDLGFVSVDIFADKHACRRPAGRRHAPPPPLTTQETEAGLRRCYISHFLRNHTAPCSLAEA